MNDAISVHASSARQSAASSIPASALPAHYAQACMATFCERMTALLTRGNLPAGAAVGNAATLGNGERADTSLLGWVVPGFATRCCCTGGGEVGGGDAREGIGNDSDEDSGDDDNGKSDSGDLSHAHCEASTANSFTSSDCSRIQMREIIQRALFQERTRCAEV